MDHVDSCSHGKFFYMECDFWNFPGPTTKPPTFIILSGTKIRTADVVVRVARLTMLTSAWVGDSETSHFSHIRVVLSGGFEVFYFHLYLVKWWVEPPSQFCWFNTSPMGEILPKFWCPYDIIRWTRGLIGNGRKCQIKLGILQMLLSISKGSLGSWFVKQICILPVIRNSVCSCGMCFSIELC